MCHTHEQARAFPNEPVSIGRPEQAAAVQRVTDAFINIPSAQPLFTGRFERRRFPSEPR